jgi:ribosomal protein L12E/L44/L45/RPP1/RPP2
MGACASAPPGGAANAPNAAATPADKRRTRNIEAIMQRDQEESQSVLK